MTKHKHEKKSDIATLEHDERKISDDDFFQAMDLSLPGLGQVATAYAAGDLARARGETVAYFHARKQPRWFCDLRGLNRSQARQKLAGEMKILRALVARDSLAGVLDSAQKMLGNRFHIPELELQHDFGPDFELESRELLEMNTLSLSFKRLPCLLWLAAAYQTTRNPAYRDKCVEVLDRYLTAWPLVWQDTSPSAYYVQTSPVVQEAMSSAVRILNGLGLLYTDLPYDRHVPVELVFRMIRSIWFTARQYRRFDTDTFRLYNHHYWERGAAPFVLALMLPEFPELAPLLDRGRKVSEEHVMRDFSSDGGSNEHSCAYTDGAALCHNAAFPAYLAKINRKIYLSAKGRRRIRRAYSLMASLVLPDGRLPDIGDSRGPEAGHLLEAGSRIFGSSACAAVLRALAGKGSGNTEKLPPRAVCYEDAGYVCGRDAWSRAANCFVMSTNTVGHMGHNHQDMLSLIMAVKGKTIIGEPASRLYSLSNTERYRESLRGYLYNMTSHNLFLVDGEPIRDDKFFVDGWGGFPPPVKIREFDSGRQHLYVSAGHEGYTHAEVRREVLFLHRRGWMLLDHAGKSASHGKWHIQRWHFEEGTEVRQIDERAVLASKGKANLLCIWPALPNMKLHLSRNELVNVGSLAGDGRQPLVLDVESYYRSVSCLFLVGAGDVSEDFVKSCREKILGSELREQLECKELIPAIKALA